MYTKRLESKLDQIIASSSDIRERLVRVETTLNSHMQDHRDRKRGVWFPVITGFLAMVGALMLSWLGLAPKQ